MSGNKYYLSIKSPINQPDYATYALEAGRREMGSKLYDILYSQKLPAVVDIEETLIPARYNDYKQYPEDELRIEVTVTPVQYRHVIMESDDYGYGIKRYKKKWWKFWK